MNSKEERKKQALNPYLPLDVCIPDGEPHVFGDRVYVYGSHDKMGGDAFCMLDYEVYSAPVTDLASWSAKGTAYSAAQDPLYGEEFRYMYAPDCARGPDGRYYLYYCMAGGRSFTSSVRIAVSDFPDGPFAYYGYVRNAAGAPLAKGITFDPAVFTEDGKIRLYYGWSLQVEREKAAAAVSTAEGREGLKRAQMALFGKTEEELEEFPGGAMGAFCCELAPDMRTVTAGPYPVAPGQFSSFGTSFEGHAFFEGSSMRKFGDTYYFIYSSENMHELCYATSARPDGDFVYRGVLVSNGDIGIGGREPKDRQCRTGNNHGSLVKIGDSYYIFYHRHTQKTSFSRQGCAEKIGFDERTGTFLQAEMTSCGLNGGPLRAEGTYSAAVCCLLTNGRMPHVSGGRTEEDIPFIRTEGEAVFLSALKKGTVAGYRYFRFAGETEITLTVRSEGTAEIRLAAGETDSVRAAARVSGSGGWEKIPLRFTAEGEKALYLLFPSDTPCDLLDFSFGKAGRWGDGTERADGRKNTTAEEEDRNG